MSEDELKKIQKYLEENKVLEFLQEIERFTNQRSNHTSKPTQSQLRNLYDIIVGMDCERDDDVKQRLLKLRIMLEYSYRRNNISDEFHKCMKNLIEYILKDENRTNPQKVKNFLQLFEALIAYSK